MPNLNLSGSLNILRLFVNPTLCLPHHTVSSFDKIPVPLSEAFGTNKNNDKKPDIRAIVLDKDNCFAIPHQNEVFPGNKAKFEELRQAYPGSKLLIVSNSSGTGADPGFKDAELLEQNTGVTVLRHTTKKPGCSGEIMDYFRSRPDSQVTKPEQVAIVGDRLFTDMMMANMMGAHSVWVRDGVVEDRNIVSATSNFLSILSKHSFALCACILQPLLRNWFQNSLITSTKEHDDSTRTRTEDHHNIIIAPKLTQLIHPSSPASRNTSTTTSTPAATRHQTLTATSNKAAAATGIKTRIINPNRLTWQRTGRQQ
jgi:phosphatidylglycerophosphatase GEP4